jgi:asparagine synthase (glutamine-hydrolysing)
VALRAIRWHGSLTRQTQRLAESWGVRLHAPFLDDPVLAACVSVPVTERTSGYVAKPLLGRALEGLVPDEVLARRSKGDYTASEYAGLRAAAPYLFKLLRDPLLADLGLIEPSAVARALSEAVDGQAAPLGALADVIAVEIWLRAVHNAELTSWTISGGWQ